MDVSGGVLTLLFWGALVAGSFLVGALNPAATIAWTLGKDLRASGSGNPGATNAGRVLGAGWGVLVAALDILKGWVPTVLVLRSVGVTVAAACGLAAVLGHIWSPFLRGRGGKGVATALGVIVAVDPWYAVVGIAAFVVALPLVRRTGLASAVAALALVVLGLLIGLGIVSLGRGSVTGWWLVVVGALVLHRHQDNLRGWLRMSRS